MRRIATLAALTAISFAALTIPADAARRHYQPVAGYSNVTQFCGDRVCSGQSRSTAQSNRRPRAASRADANGSPDYRKRLRVAKATEGYRRPSYGQTSYLPHPPGCPARAFCACGAAYRVFGSPIRSLWPSSAWFKFPRTSPASGMVAVRHGHVFVLESYVGGNEWVVSDYNSGGHLSRRHVRSLSGYIIVNPHGFKTARLR